MGNVRQSDWVPAGHHPASPAPCKPWSCLGPAQNKNGPVGHNCAEAVARSCLAWRVRSESVWAREVHRCTVLPIYTFFSHEMQAFTDWLRWRSVQEGSLDGMTSVEQTTPVHASCNLSACHDIIHWLPHKACTLFQLQVEQCWKTVKVVPAT